MDEFIKREDALKIIDSYSKACTDEGKVIANSIRDIIAVITPAADVAPRAKVATEVLGILYKELVYYRENIKNEYMELPQKSTNTAHFRGASSTVEHICNMILKLEKKYTEEEQHGKRTDH